MARRRAGSERWKRMQWAREKGEWAESEGEGRWEASVRSGTLIVYGQPPSDTHAPPPQSLLSFIFLKGAPIFAGPQSPRPTFRRWFASFPPRLSASCAAPPSAPLEPAVHFVTFLILHPSTGPARKELKEASRLKKDFAQAQLQPILCPRIREWIASCLVTSVVVFFTCTTVSPSPPLTSPRIRGVDSCLCEGIPEVERACWRTISLLLLSLLG
jgi:hypothetical protein